MSTTSLVAEFLVIGLTPLLIVVFIVLSILGIYDLSFLSEIKDSSTLLVVVVTLADYLLGALTHRLGQVLNRNSLRFLNRRTVESRTRPSDEWLDKYVLVLQQGSEPLVSRVQYGESLLRIFKSTAITTPILAVALAWWLSIAAGWKAATIALVICLFVTVISFASFVLQRRNHERLLEIAVKLIKKKQ